MILSYGQSQSGCGSWRVRAHPSWFQLRTSCGIARNIPVMSIRSPVNVHFEEALVNLSVLLFDIASNSSSFEFA